MDGYWKRLGHFCGVVSLLVGCQGDALREATRSKLEFATDLDGQCRLIRRYGTGRFLDADTGIAPKVVTSPYVGDSTQNWCFTLQGAQNGTRYFTVQHETFGGRFLDTNLSNGVILRDEENNSSQEWLLGAAGAEGGPEPDATERTRIRQRNTNRYLDEYMHPLTGATAVSTQPWQADHTQTWDIIDESD